MARTSPLPTAHPWLGVVILAVLAVLVGAATQRIAGMGFSMVVAPFLALSLGPHQGVVLGNACSAIAAVLTWWQVRADVDWRTFGWLTSTSVIGVLIGTVLAGQVAPAPLQVVLGAVLIVAVVASLLVARTAVRLTGRRWQAATGTVTGALVASAGVGGPPMSIYAVLSRWPQRSFVATMQPYQAVLSAVAVGFTLIVAPENWPDLSAGFVAALAGALVLGLLAGILISRRVSPRIGRVVVISLALLGAGLTFIHGIAAL